MSQAAAKVILIVEDDAKIARLLADYLRLEKFLPVIESDGRRAVACVHQIKPQAIILDLMLPGQDGIEICREVRKFSVIPILMLTARVEEIDRVIGLDTGADDYICKPFGAKEVMARLRAQLRRTDGCFAASVELYRIDDAANRIFWGEVDLKLTSVEYRLLRALILRPGAIFGRARLLEILHDDFRDVSDRAIDSHIKNVRKKLTMAGAPEDLIASIYGMGYRFEF